VLLHPPPSPEAYREYLAGEDVFYKDDNAALAHFERASRLDSSFVYPLLREQSILTNQGRMTAADSVGKLITRHAGSLTEYEQAYETYAQSIALGDAKGEYEAAGRMVRTAPRAVFPRYGLAIAAIIMGHPREADSIFGG